MKRALAFSLLLADKGCEFIVKFTRNWCEMVLKPLSTFCLTSLFGFLVFKQVVCMLQLKSVSLVFVGFVFSLPCFLFWTQRYLVV